MPSVRKLSPDEVRLLTNPRKGVRKQVEAEYDAIMGDYAAGDYGLAELGESENRLTVRNRLKAAADRRNLALVFRRTNGPVIRFQVIEKANAAPEPEIVATAPIVATPKARKPRAPKASAEAAVASEVAAEAAPKRKPGRPKKLTP
jgi:hypothetical protein